MPRPRLLPDPAGKELSTLERPPDWDQVFGAAGPLELEIGCGPGGFALEYARRHPSIRLIAFEWRQKYARFTEHKGKEAGLHNLRVVEADAKAVLPRIFAEGSLDCIHLQFPDPWWKRSHLKRTVASPEFAPILFALTKPGGMFDFRTDVEERAHPMLTVLEEAGFENPLGPGAFHPYDPEEVPSTRERRYLISGQPVFRARLRKPR